MTLARAWEVLGKDVRLVLSPIRSLHTREERVRAVTELLNDAKKLGKRIMADNHPDKSSSPSSKIKFGEAQDALFTIESYTNELVSKNREIEEKLSNSNGLIVIK